MNLRTSIKFISGLIIVSIFLISGCAQAQQEEMTDVVLPVGYIPSVQFAPFYVGITNGYYEEVGLNVTMQYGYEIDGVSLVGSGEYYFAVASGEQVVLARDKGLPITYVMNWYKDYPVGIAALAESGISSLSDLNGVTVGIPALQGASYIAYKGFETTGEFSPETIDLQVVGFNQAEMLSQGEIDAAVVYIANEPVVLDNQGFNVTTFPISDFVSLVGNGIVVGDQIIEANPQMIRDFISATLKAIEYSVENPEETYEICKEFVPNLDEDMVQYDVLLASIPFWTTNGGMSDPEAWITTNELVHSLDMTNTDVPVAELFTNDFLK
jgi:NitT/TauT family transport system substrate-binding protein